MAHEPTTANCWAPEIIWDDAQQHYLIYWSSTVPGNFRSRTNRAQGQDKPPRNHRLYFDDDERFRNIHTDAGPL